MVVTFPLVAFLNLLFALNRLKNVLLTFQIRAGFSTAALFRFHRRRKACIYKVLLFLEFRRKYSQLTDCSRPAEVNYDITSIAGIASALISVVADPTLTPSSYPSGNPDKLRCINAGKTRIAFFLRPPLYYVSVSKWGEPESIVSRSVT